MMPGLEQCAIEIASCARLATEMSVPPSIIPSRSGERTRWCAACGGACRIAENRRKINGGQKSHQGVFGPSYSVFHLASGWETRGGIERG